MICRLPFVRKKKKTQAPRQAQHQIRKPAVQRSSKAVGKTDDGERRGYSPTTVFPVFATTADDASYIVRDNNHHQRQAAPVPPWLIVLLIVVALMWISPLGTVVALFMLGMLLTAHPQVAIALGMVLLLLTIAALRERWHGRPF
jgi:hypothetical protein